MIRQAGETGQLYGSVAGRDVAEAIQAEGGKVERSQVVLNTAIKTLGVHEVLVRLHPEVSATVKINIARSADEAERQAKGEDVIRSSLGGSESSSWSRAELDQRSFYPISFPLTVGPGTIAAAIALGAHPPGRVMDWVISGTAYVLGALGTAIGVYLTYRFARPLLRFLGEMGTSVVMRLSAFILLCIGFEIMWTGLSALLAELT